MQKLLKAMPDVRRDYVRELDTALVESRILLALEWRSTRSLSRSSLQLSSRCHLDQEAQAIRMTLRCCESRLRVPSRPPRVFGEDALVAVRQRRVDRR